MQYIIIYAHSVLYYLYLHPFTIRTLVSSIFSFPDLLSPITDRTSQAALVVKNPPANARDVRDPGSIPGLGHSLGGGHSNPLQYSSLENPIERGALRATVHGVTKSRK